MSGKDDIYLGDLSLIFILHLNILGKRESHKSHQKDADKFLGYSRGSVPSRRLPCIPVFCGIPRD